MQLKLYSLITSSILCAYLSAQEAIPAPGGIIFSDTEITPNIGPANGGELQMSFDNQKTFKVFSSGIQSSPVFQAGQGFEEVVTAGNWYRIAVCNSSQRRANALFTLHDNIGNSHSTVVLRAGMSYNSAYGAKRAGVTLLSNTGYRFDTFTSVRLVRRDSGHDGAYYLEVRVSRSGSVRYLISENTAVGAWSPLDWELVPDEPAPGYEALEYDINKVFMVGDLKPRLSIARGGAIAIDGSLSVAGSPVLTQNSTVPGISVGNSAPAPTSGEIKITNSNRTMGGVSNALNSSNAYLSLRDNHSSKDMELLMDPNQLYFTSSYPANKFYFNGDRTFSFRSPLVEFGADGDPTDVEVNGNISAEGDIAIIGNGSFSSGFRNNSNGGLNFTIGHDNTLNTFGSLVLGTNNEISNSGSSVNQFGHNLVVGQWSDLTDTHWSFSVGWFNNFSPRVGNASGGVYGSFSSGFENEISDSYATAIGWDNKVSSTLGTAIGHGLEVKSASALMVGQYNATSGSSEDYSLSDTDQPIFVIGNGTADARASRSDALVVKRNGDIIIPKSQGDISMGAFGPAGN